MLLDGAAAGITNAQVRQACSVDSVHMCLIKRRIHLWQKMAKSPSEHYALSAALAGKVGKSPLQLNGEIPEQSANPWLKQAWGDVQTVAQASLDMQEQVQKHG